MAIGQATNKSPFIQIQAQWLMHLDTLLDTPLTLDSDSPSDG